MCINRYRRRHSAKMSWRILTHHLMANVEYRASLLFKTGYNIYAGRINVIQAESIVVSPVSLNVSTGSLYDIN